MRRCPLLAFVSLLLLSSMCLLAQGQAVPMPSNIGDSPMPSVHHAEEEGRLEFKSQTVLVQVPVVVTDKAGAHVHGLGRDHFKVFENGKEQKISSVEEIQATHTPFVAPAAVPKGEFSNVAANGDSPRVITVIVLDTINTPFTDQAHGRKELLKYLANSVDPGQMVALVTIGSGGMRVIQPPTADPAVLAQALKKVSGELDSMHGVDVDTQAAIASGEVIADPAAPVAVVAPGDVGAQLQDFVLHGDTTIGRMVQQRAIEVTMKGFLTIALSLSGMPGRKALIWVTGGFPFYMDSPSAVPGGYLSALYYRAMQAMNEAEISVYPVDAKGLVTYQSDSVLHSTSNTGLGGFGGPSSSRQLSNRSWLQNSTNDTLKDFAEMTGGRAFYNTNDLATSFRLAADDSSSYYLLGYYLDTKNTKAGWRQLKVKIDKPGTQVRSRNGFFVTGATADPEVSRKLDMQFAFASPFESTGIPMTVSWEDATPSGDKKKVGFNVHLPATGLMIDQANNNHFSMDFSAIAFKKDVNAGNIGRTMQGNLPAGSMEKLKASGVNFKSDLELAPGDYMVRVVIRDNLSGRIGSVSAPLTVN
jgi:VWFA-related protein